MDLSGELKLLSLFSTIPEKKLALTDKEINIVDRELLSQVTEFEEQNPKLYQSTIDKQYRLEKAMIGVLLNRVGIENKECQHLKNKFPAMDLNKLAVRANSHYYNPKIMEIESCMINAFVPFSLEPKYRSMKLFWGKILSLASGINGTVAKPINKALDQFVIKYANPTDDKSVKIRRETNNIHEVFIALHLNRYRKFISNYAYCFGYFKCNSPLDFGAGETSICNTEGDNNFIIYESIKGKSLKEVMTWNKVAFDKLLNYYLQILLALYTARDLQFTHYDLHTANIIIRPTGMKEKTAITYIIDGEKYYLETNEIATMVDFGYSYIQINGVGYGMPDMEHGGVYRDRPNQIMDAHKLWGFMSYNVMKSGDVKMLELMMPIMEYFHGKKYDLKTFKTYLSEDIKLFFYIPAMKVDYSHLKLIRYIIQNYPSAKKFLKPSTELKILGCKPAGDFVCVKDETDFLRKINIYDPVELVYIAKTGKLADQTIADFKNHYVKNKTMVKWNKGLSKELYSLVGALELFEEDSDVIKYLNTYHKIPKEFLISSRNFSIDATTIIDLYSTIMIKWDITIYNYRLLSLSGDIRSLNDNRELFDEIETKFTTLHAKFILKEEENSLLLKIMLKNLKDERVGDINDFFNNDINDNIDDVNYVYQITETLGRYLNVDATFNINAKI